MRTEKLSVNKVCMVACAALFLLSIAMPVTIYFLTQNVLALCCGLLYAVCVAGCMTAFLAFVRRKLTLFSDALCKLLDETIGDGYKHDASDLSKLNKFEKQIAKTYNLTYVAIPNTETTLDVHPTIKGHQYIANKLVNAIENP